MSALTATRAGRRAAEALMVDTCTVRRVTGRTTDDTTGAVTPTYSTIYTGRCKVQQASAMGQRTQAGQLAEVLLRLEVHLPVAGSEGVRQGDEVIIAAAALDSALVGKVFRVHDQAAKTLATARRLGVEEVT